MRAEFIGKGEIDQAFDLTPKRMCRQLRENFVVSKSECAEILIANSQRRSCTFFGRRKLRELLYLGNGETHILQRKLIFILISICTVLIIP
jgi:hypothetical protein